MRNYYNLTPAERDACDRRMAERRETLERMEAAESMTQSQLAALIASGRQRAEIATDE